MRIYHGLRAVCLGCVWLVLLAVLAACGAGGDNAQQASGGEASSPPSVTDGEEAGLPLIRNGNACFVIAYGEGLDETAARAMNMLADEMQETFGVEVADPQPWSGALAGSGCIVFGEVQTEACQTLWSQLRLRDYAVSLSDRQLYIAAGNSSGYGMAVNTLLADLSEYVTGEQPAQSLTVPPEYHYYQEGTYVLNSTQINGVDLRDFVLLAPSDPLITEPVVEKVAAALAEGYGYMLPGAEQRPESTRALRMEIDPELGLLRYGYRVEDGDLVLCAGGPFSMYCAAEEIVGLLRTGDTDRFSDVRLEDGDSELVSLLDRPDGLDRAESSSLRLMSCNIMANGFEPAFTGWSDTGDVTFEMRTEIFESFVDIFQPDVIGIQEFSPSWYNWWQEAYAGTPWRLSSAGLDGRPESTGMINPIMYRSDLYTVVEEGWRDYSVSNSARYARYMSWIVLESVQTGDRFALVNVHWDGWSKPEANAVQRQETLAKIKELAGKYGCPVFNTGDFNTDEEDPDYSAYLEDGCIRDAKFNCDILVNNIGSCHGWAQEPAADWSFDHIFTTQDAVIRQFCTASYNQQIYASDHAWLLADIAIGQDAEGRQG